jgi:sulfatase maturation enzyme AslB (radical SAM superfamily)
LKTQSDGPPKPPKYPLSNQLSKQTDKQLNQLSKISKKEKEREERKREEDNLVDGDLFHSGEKDLAYLASGEALRLSDLGGAKSSLGDLASSKDTDFQEATEETQRKARDDHFRDVAAKSTPKRFDVIYQPSGAALEYAPWACNIVKSPIKDKYKGVIGPKICSHGCLYCFNQQGTESGPILKDDIINRLNKDLSKLKNLIKQGERLEFTFVGDLYDPALPEEIARQCLMA